LGLLLRIVIGFGTAVGAILLACAGVPGRNGTVDPYWSAKLAARKPDVVLMGNSILDDAVDIEAFNEASGANAMTVWNSGAASAWQYVVFKNVIVRAPHRPLLVIVFFRDHYLTAPGFRTRGRYREEIERFTESDELLLDRLTGDGPAMSFVRRRDSVKERLEEGITGVACALMGRRRSEAQTAFRLVLGPDKAMPGMLTQRQMAAETLSEAALLDFPSALRESFLPEMIRLADESGVRLVYARMKRRPDGAGGRPDAEALDRYIGALRAYLAEHDVDLVDFTPDTRLRLEHYAVGDHLDVERGRPVFLPILVQALAPYLDEPR
jgi:hypothetical protein